MNTTYGSSKIGVGIIGLSASGGWAAQAHLPALTAVPGFGLKALSASNGESARRAATKFGVPYAAESATDLVERDDVDLVVVAVKVPEHYELVSAALAAGKDVYCEWPLGNGLDEAEQLAAAAEAAGRRAFVGLQARSSPTVRFIRDLIADGYIGEPLSTSVIASGGQWGGITNSRNKYQCDARSGASLLSIPFGHTIDGLTMVLGEFEDLVSVTATRRSHALDTDTGQRVPVTVSDQIAVSGTLGGGAVASVHFRGGRSRGTNLLWEINGTDGDIVVTGDIGHLQLAQLTVQGVNGDGKSLAELSVPHRYNLSPGLSGTAGPATNLANAYAQVHRDLVEATQTVPDFHHAVRRHKMLERIACQA